MAKLFDVLAVGIADGIVKSILAEGKSEKAAEGIITMAVVRRGVETEYYTECLEGKYKVGDKIA